MWNMIWPVMLVVAANTFYHICSKSTPSSANSFLSLTLTYLIAGVISFIAFLCGGHGSLASELKSLNWTSAVLALAIVALEFGFICIYRAGWKVSAGSLTANICLACVLVFVGALLYRESISLRQLAGIAVCIAGLVLVNG